MSDMASDLRTQINETRKKIESLDIRKNAVINARNKLASIEKQVGKASALSRNLSSAFAELKAGALWGTAHLTGLADYDEENVLGILRIDCSSFLETEIQNCLNIIQSETEKLRYYIAEYNKLV